mgnify:CR=1 FL=1
MVTKKMEEDVKLLRKIEPDFLDMKSEPTNFLVELDCLAHHDEAVD